MMLAGALRRAVDDDGSVVFVTRGGVAIELRAGEKARVTGGVDLVLRGDPESLLAHLDASLTDDYEEFSFERNEPQPLELRPHVSRIRVKVAFRTKPFMTLVVEVAPVEAGGDEIEEIAAHDLSTIGLDGPDIIPVLAIRWQIAQKLHAVTEPPLRLGGENPRYWDLVDPQLLQALVGQNLAPVKDACQRIFAARGQAIISRDRWWAYDHLDPARRQVCWSHLVRDFRFHAESPLAHQSEFGEACLRIAEKVFEAWRAFQRSGDRYRLRLEVDPLERELRVLCQAGKRKSTRTRYHRGLARNLIKA